jgi:hypothetical protein
MSNDSKAISLALAHAVASHKVPDEVVARVADKISAAKHKVRGVDICKYGICIDYILDGSRAWNSIPDLVQVPGSQIYGLRVFPWGIPDPDLLHIQVEHAFEELAPYVERGI